MDWTRSLIFSMTFSGRDEVGQLGDDDALFPRRDALDPGRCPGAERSTPGEVCVANPFQANDLAAAWEIWAGHEPHQVVQRARRVGDEVTRSADDLDEVVGGHVRGHPDGDTTGIVDQGGSGRLPA